MSTVSVVFCCGARNGVVMSGAAVSVRVKHMCMRCSGVAAFSPHSEMHNTEMAEITKQWMMIMESMVQVVGWRTQDAQHRDGGNK